MRGSTVAVLRLADDRAVIGHVGDSRVYRLRGGVIAQLNSSWCVRVKRDDLVTFQVDGTYGYICEPHYGLGMVGLVVMCMFAMRLLLGFIFVLLTLAVLIAALGIVNTLALSVIERTREIGLLRAVGMGRRQVRRMIRLESVVIAIFGTLLGLALGVALGAALVRALNDEGIDQLVIPFGQLAVYLVVGALIGVLAAVWPARRAARLDVLRAITTE